MWVLLSPLTMCYWKEDALVRQRLKKCLNTLICIQTFKSNLNKSSTCDLWWGFIFIYFSFYRQFKEKLTMKESAVRTAGVNCVNRFHMHLYILRLKDSFFSFTFLSGSWKWMELSLFFWLLFTSRSFLLHVFSAQLVILHYAVVNVHQKRSMSHFECWFCNSTPVKMINELLWKTRTLLLSLLLKFTFCNFSS